MKKEELELANRYLDGELGPEETDSFEDRLLADTSLKVYVDDLKALDDSAKVLEVLKAPEIHLSRRGRHLYSDTRFRLKPFLAGAAVAAACLLVGIGVGVKIIQPPAGSVSTEAFRIVYYAPGASSVSVLGDFNGWAGEIPLKQRGKGGYWLAELHVKPGEYRYILMVDGEERPGDPLADYVIDDDFGSKNSVVRIGL